MKDFQTLKILDLFKHLFLKLGIDYPSLRKILQVKLTLDGRRVPTVFNQYKKKTSEKLDTGNSFIKSLWIYALMGLFLVPFILMKNNEFFQMTIAFSVIIFIIMTSMISDFSSVLLDIRDKNILHTKPIDKATLSAARSIHICIYLFFLTAAVTGIPLIIALFNQGLEFFLLFLADILLADTLIVVLTALVYFMILKFFDGEKLKDIINYVQIALSIVVIAGYQLAARSFELVDLHFEMTVKWWQMFIPSIWFGSTFDLLLNHHYDSRIVIFSLLSIIIPASAIMGYIKLIPSFERNLQKLAYSAGARKASGNWLQDKLALISCRNREERSFFRFAGIMFKNERDFKLKVYPSLGFSFILPFILIFNQSRMNSLDHISSGKMYLTLYFSVLMLPTIVLMMRYSGKAKGAWIFKSFPIQDIQLLFKGTLKAAMVKLFLPIYLPLSIIYIYIFGIRIFPDLLVILISACLFIVICFKVLKSPVPFSEPFEAVQQNESWMIIPLLLVLGVFAGIHMISIRIPFGVYGYSVFLLIANWLTWKNTFKKAAENISS
ncbi:hypothetical protein [Falsibacillus albus]|uniref:Uncharacterized protein n=1 Tax=Falsibacillus albus TaxID=2478915 RepID=A0A3L7JSI9_9BACI|nr:hypothetical protein [Falsibacillus albus]RLQ93847.1 hypothetical protein D9X91_16395 [Falsibacillus albus]